jgi:transposase
MKIRPLHDRVIIKRHAEGASLRTIADEAGVSHQTVVNIIRRHGA